MDRRNRPSALAATPALPPQARVDLIGDRVTAALPTGETVEILLTGATVVSWTAQGRENLWLSESAVLDGSKAVRGGIPVVFPVFGPSPADRATSKLPQHGLARTSRWEFLGKSTSEAEAAPPSAGGSSSTKAGGSSASGVQLDFGLSAASADPALRALWPFDFSLLYRVTLEPASLTTSIVVTNEGSDPFDFQVLLHTYLRVGVRVLTALVFFASLLADPPLEHCLCRDRRPRGRGVHGQGRRRQGQDAGGGPGGNLGRDGPRVRTGERCSAGADGAGGWAAAVRDYTRQPA